MSLLCCYCFDEIRSLRSFRIKMTIRSIHFGELSNVESRFEFASPFERLIANPSIGFVRFVRHSVSITGHEYTRIKNRSSYLFHRSSDPPNCTKVSHCPKNASQQSSV